MIDHPILLGISPAGQTHPFTPNQTIVSVTDGMSWLLLKITQVHFVAQWEMRIVVIKDIFKCIAVKTAATCGKMVSN